MKYIVITGASRGIGLALTQLYCLLGETVFALCRQPTPALAQTGATVISGIDVSQADVATQIKQQLSHHLENSTTIDLIINNAGIMHEEFINSLDYNHMLDQFKVNSLAPLMISQALAPMMAKGAKIAMITSRMGSIDDNTSGGYYGYRMSKTALNIASVSLAQDLAPRGIAVAVLHPGFVQTDMVGGAGNITPQECAQALAQRIDETNLTNSGQFRHSDGQILPW